MQLWQPKKPYSTIYTTYDYQGLPHDLGQNNTNSLGSENSWTFLKFSHLPPFPNPFTPSLNPIITLWLSLSLSVSYLRFSNTVRTKAKKPNNNGVSPEYLCWCCSYSYGGLGGSRGPSGSNAVCVWGLGGGCGQQQPPQHFDQIKLPSLWQGLCHPHAYWEVLQWKACHWLHWYVHMHACMHAHVLFLCMEK